MRKLLIKILRWVEQVYSCTHSITTSQHGAFGVQRVLRYLRIECTNCPIIDRDNKLIMVVIYFDCSPALLNKIQALFLLNGAGIIDKELRKEQLNIHQSGLASAIIKDIMELENE